MAARKRRLKKENMSIKKYFFSQISVVVSILLLTTIQPLAAESASDAKRIEELERTVVRRAANIYWLFGLRCSFRRSGCSLRQGGFCLGF
jgi:hypothetical protein